MAHTKENFKEFISKNTPRAKKSKEEIKEIMPFVLNEMLEDGDFWSRGIADFSSKLEKHGLKSSYELQFGLELIVSALGEGFKDGNLEEFLEELK